MSNALATMKNGNGTSQVETDPTIRETEGQYFTPRFDFWDGEHEWILCGDLPGVTADNLELHVDNGQLTVHGRVPQRHEGTPYLAREYGVADFYRTFTVGDEIDFEHISAEMKNGVLTIRLPKPEAVKPRRIEVKAG